MLAAPEDLDTSELGRVIQDSWGIEAATVAYAAAGHGSHNWRVVAPDGRRWFLKAYRHNADSSFFDATHRTAAALHAAGLGFIAAPIPDRQGRLRPAVSDRWELALLPFIEGRNTASRLEADRVAVAEVVGRLHAFGPVPEGALRWTPGYLQPELRQLLAGDLDRPWRSGPYGERARSLLARHRPGIEHLLDLSDRLVKGLEEPEGRWVITHGEPHGGNAMRDTAGAIHLIDCDAMMVAPRERDLRLLLHAGHRRSRGLDPTAVLAAYRSTAGDVEVKPSTIELFRAEWHLMEIGRYATQFSRPHREDEDSAFHWLGLRSYVPVEQNWPRLAA